MMQIKLSEKTLINYSKFYWRKIKILKRIMSINKITLPINIIFNKKKIK
jgi:hypothetical protein